MKFALFSSYLTIFRISIIITKPVSCLNHIPQHSIPWPRSLFFPCLFPINPTFGSPAAWNFSRSSRTVFHMSVRDHLNVSFCEIRILHLEFQYSWNPCLSPPRGQRRWALRSDPTPQHTSPMKGKSTKICTIPQLPSC